MTSKERVLRTLNFEEPDRAPFNLWLDENSNPDTPEEYKKFTKKYGSNFRLEHFDVDVIETFANLEWPMRSGIHSLVKSIDELEDLALPDPSLEDTYSEIKRTLLEYPDKAVSAQILGIITIMSAFIMNYKDFFEHLFLSPRKLRNFIRKIGIIWEEVTKRVCDLGIAFLYLQDDIASTKGLMMSPQSIDEFAFKPLMPCIEIAKKANIPVLFHSDGNTMDILDRLVEMGIKAVNPFEPHLNDLSLFKEKYHGKLGIYGGLNNSYIIPHGTPEQVEKHVIETFEKSGKGGGLILSSAAIPYLAPEENIETMVGTIKEKCIYRK